ncbi:MAG: hypothetical protein LUD77_08835 [Clostridiales bacterium]|nr:hypothetical protein [Clostridiales bacterium]
MHLRLQQLFCDFLIGVFDALAEKIPELAESVKKVLSAVIDVFRDAVGNMSSEDVTNLIMNLGLISALMFVLSGLSAIIPEAVVGVAGLGALIGELAVVLAAVGALGQIPGLDRLISEGGNLLEKIGVTLGQFVGGLVGGIASGITGQLPGIAEDLSLFMTNLQPFIEGARSIDSSSMEGIKALAGALLALTASELLNGISKWLTGGTSLADFGAELSAFAPVFADYADAVSGTDFSNVAVSAEALRDFCDAAKEIPNQGGVIALFTVDNTLLDFAYGLAAFGVNWTAYALLVQGVDFSGVKPSAEALKDFCDAAKEIPNSGGLAGLFSGGNNLTTFGAGLQSFGKNLKSFAENTSDIDDDFADNMGNAAGALISFAEASEASDEGKDLKNFGQKLEAFGVSFKTFCNSIRDADFDSSGVSSAASVLNSIVDSAVTAVNEKTETFTTIGKTITDKLKGGIQAKASELISAAKTVTERVITNVRNYYEKFKAAGVYLTNGFAQGIKAEKSKAIEASIELAKETLTAAKNELGIALPSKVFRDEVGAQLGAGLAEGIAAGTPEAVEASEEMSDEVIKAAKEKFSNFKEWLEDEDFYGRLTTENEIYAYEQAAEQFKDIPDISKEINKKLYTLRNEAAEEAKKAQEEQAKAYEEGLKTNYENAKDYCDKEQAYNRMNEAEYIEYWEKVLETTELRAEDIETIEEDLYKKRHEYMEGNLELIEEEINRQNELLSTYEEGSTAYSNALKELAVLEEERAKAQEEIRDADYESAKAYAEKEQAFNRMNEEEYIAYWQNILDTTELNADAVEEIQEDLYKKRHEYIEGSVELIDDEIERQNKLLETFEEGSKEYEDILKELTLLENERAEAIKETAEALAEAEYNQAMNAFNTEQDYGGMSGLLQQLDYYQQLLPKVVNDAEKYSSVLNQIYSITKKIYDTQKEYEESVAKVYAEAAEERTEVTKQYYEDMTEIEEEYEEKREELEEEYADKVEEINEQLEEDIAELEEAYEDALEERADALYDAYGLFDEVSEKDEVSGSDLMQNLQGQIDEFKEWTELLDSLADRGMDEGFIEELQEMGVSSSIAELRALNDMTDSELEQYATLWAEKHQLATDRATAELEDLRTETDTQIAGLQSDAAEELDEYVETWQEEMDELNQQMIDDLDELRDEFKTKLRTITSNTQSQLQSLKSEFDSAMGLINDNVEDEFNDMVNTVNDIIESANWESMGRNIVDGLINGVSQRQSAFASAMTNLINIGEAAARSAAEIASPSKVFAEIGEYMVLGLVEGINGYSGLAEEASGDMAESAISIASDSLLKIGELAEDNFDLEPVISPVLDLDNVVNGVYAIEDLLSPVQSMNLGSAISLSNQNEYSGAEEFMEKMSISAKKSNESVVSAIESLQKDFGNLSNKIERLKIYMDTGTLVGAIAPDMDKALGRRAKMSGRGVI